MKIGIVTFHRAENFGAMLQAVGLRTALEQLGHKTYFIDYWPKAHEGTYKIWNFEEFRHRTLASKCLYLAKNILLSRPLHKRHREFKRFFNKHIAPYCIAETAEVDLALYGSDQIWGRLPQLRGQFDAFYFGENGICAKRHSSYAASMGNSLVNGDETEFLKSSLLKFDKIGVRELDVKDLLNRLNLENVTINCDPTLLLSEEQWNSMVPAERIIKKPYVLYYNLLYGSFNDIDLKQLVEAQGLRLITIKGVIERSSFSRDELSGIGPESFIRLIRDAEFIFTSSFHGLALSIIFKKNFYASYLTKASRAQTLLSEVGLLDRLLPPASNLSNYGLSPIDYSAHSKLLHNYIMLSKNFLTLL